MDGGSSEGSEARFAAYVEALGVVLGHADRQQPMHDYCLGLLMPIERKSVEPMAAVTAPGQVAAKHQSLLHFVGNAPWSDAAMLGKVAELVLPAIERSGPVGAWIRRRLIVALARTLPRCPCCNTPIRKTARIPHY
jgi:SRSO17 transposase